MKALSKDPRRRHQSMEELVRELQRSYGSVRYRRSLQTPREDKEITRPGPIPLQQKAKRPANPIATGSTPPGTIALRPPGGFSWGKQDADADPAGRAARRARQPILLTKRKERRKTLPLALGQTPTRIAERRHVDAGGPRSGPCRRRSPRRSRRRAGAGDRAKRGQHDLARQRLVGRADRRGRRRRAHHAHQRSLTLRASETGRRPSARDALLVGDAAGRRRHLAALLGVVAVGIRVASDGGRHPATGGDHQRRCRPRPD